MPRRRNKTRILQRFLYEHREAVLYVAAFALGIVGFLSVLHSCSQKEEPPPPAVVRVVAEL